jgi:hypothetical protein
MYFPAGHEVHWLAKAVEKVPLLHAMQCVALVAAYCPGVQPVHVGSGLLAQPPLQLQLPPSVVNAVSVFVLKMHWHNSTSPFSEKIAPPLQQKNEGVASGPFLFTYITGWIALKNSAVDAEIASIANGSALRKISVQIGPCPSQRQKLEHPLRKNGEG